MNRVDARMEIGQENPAAFELDDSDCRPLRACARHRQSGRVFGLGHSNGNLGFSVYRRGVLAGYPSVPAADARLRCLDRADRNTSRRRLVPFTGCTKHRRTGCRRREACIYRGPRGGRQFLFHDVRVWRIHELPFVHSVDIQNCRPRCHSVLHAHSRDFSRLGHTHRRSVPLPCPPSPENSVNRAADGKNRHGSAGHRANGGFGHQYHPHRAIQPSLCGPAFRVVRADGSLERHRMQHPRYIE